MKRPQITVIGQVCIDENRTENAEYRSWGSAAMYIAEYFRKHHDLQVPIISTYGPDFLEFAENTVLIPDEPSAKHTLLYRNIVTPDGYRRQECMYADDASPPLLNSAAVAALSRADICIAAFILPNYSVEYLRDALSQCPRDCLKILGAQGYFREVDGNGRILPRESKEVAELLALFDIVVLSEEDHPRALEFAYAWREMTEACLIVVTKGPRGALALGRDSEILIETDPIPVSQVVDSVGCGDTFEASLALEYWRNKDIGAAIRAGHQAASELLRSRFRH